MTQNFAGRVVVITGASSGVGRALARAFGGERARVAVMARGREALAATAAEIAAAGGESIALAVDVSDAAAVDTAAALVVDLWGGIDVWINNAMVSVFAPAVDVTAAEVRRVTEVNYLGTVHGTLAALRHMRPRDQGHVIQIGSALAYRSIPLQSAYCASKAAARGFTDSLRSELIHSGSRIAVSMVHLPAVNTPQFDVVRNKLGKHAHPVPPVYQPELIAEAILDVARRPRREVWLGWPTVKAMIGQKVIPGALDHYLAGAAWDSQTTDAVPPTGRDNLFSPLPGDRGARGAFDGEARASSGFMWAARHATALAFASAVVAGAAASIAIARRGVRNE